MLLNIILIIFPIVIIYICLSSIIIKYQCKQIVELRNEIKYYNDNLPEISKAYQSFLKKGSKKC